MTPLLIIVTAVSLPGYGYFRFLPAIGHSRYDTGQDRHRIEPKHPNLVPVLALALTLEFGQAVAQLCGAGDGTRTR